MRISSNSRIVVQLSVGLLITLTNVVDAQHCNYVTLVKCFINILDEWTWTLYELKENVVTINQEQCEHLRQLDRCIQDDGPEPHECNHNEIVAASNTVSDLLTHRKNSGSFLKSYYLLTYACSPEGQELLNEHRSCLSRERIGEMTLSAGTYLSEKFLEHPDDEVCTEVNNKLKEYMEAMSGLCEEEAALIMCKSLTNMFKGLHADKLHNCEFSCLRLRLSQNHHHHQLPSSADDDDASAAAAAAVGEGGDQAQVVQGHAAPANGHDLNGVALTAAMAPMTMALFVGVAVVLM